MPGSKVAVAIVVFAFSMNPSFGGGIIVTTGNSITNGYGGHRMQAEVSATGRQAQVVRVASSGATTARYLGLEVDATGAYRDYTQLVMDEDPNVIVFMLGTNDALRIASGSMDVATFRANYEAILDTFLAARNTSGQRPVLLVATILPIVAPQYAAAADIAEQDLNPWIRQVALERGIPLLDLNLELRQLPDWQDLYSDGIHLWANGAWGYWWMAQRCAAAIDQLELVGCGCLADYDCSGQVGLSDVATVLQQFGQGEGGDLNFDGQTDLSDLATVLARFGRSCP